MREKVILGQGRNFENTEEVGEIELKWGNAKKKTSIQELIK
jgi:hypothetical protein